MEEFKIIAKTFQGLEEVLAKELINLGANNVEIGRRMVSFTGNKEMLYKANFCLRTAVKVLKPIKEFKATDADEVYEVVKQMEWSDYMDNSNTFLVDAVVFSEKFRHSKFVAYRTKHAIADYFRDKTGERPNVGITNPDIRINVHIAEDEVTISLDSSGESLHRRGYRQDSVAAPLNEVLAAGMIMLTGWDGECDLIDPMCGSGTILIEAALIAQNIYPGVFRKEFAFERWKDFDADLFDHIYNDDSQEREFYHKIYGYDINRKAVASALENVRSAGVNNIVEVEQRDFYDFEQPVEKSIMITNPPYGERITTNDILGLYEAIGERLKHAFVGNEAWVLSYHDECFAKIGMRPSTKYALFNGALECEFRKYQIFDGKLSKRREEGFDIKSDDDRKRNLKFKPHKHKDEAGEGDKRTGYGRGERKTDNEDHYFKSRPFEGKRRSKFDDGSDTELDRHSFKWGDRKASDYKGDERKTDRNPFGKREDKRERKPFERKEGGKPFGERKERKPFEGKRGGKPFGDKRNDRRNEGRNNRDNRNTKWGFDSEGRPFRKIPMRIKHIITFCLLSILMPIAASAQGKWMYDFIVPDDGTFRQAIHAANTRKDKAKRYRIFVKSGHYRMHTNPNDTISTVIDGKTVRFPSPIITLTAPNTSIIGEGAGHTQIENCPKYEGISITSTLFLKGADSTYIQDLELWSNFRNDPNLFANRAVALNEKRCKGNVLKNVSLLSTQDTYYTNDGGSTYLEDCAIAGTVDFICGGGTVFFNRCELRLVPRGDSGKRDIIAAPATAAGQNYGYVFNDCQVRGAEFQDGKYLLARPWKNEPKAVFINTLMHLQPNPAGWGEMHGTIPSLFAEYGSMDRWYGLVDLTNRKTEFKDKTGATVKVAYKGELTDEDMDNYSIEQVFAGWEAQEVARQITPPELIIKGRTITWEDIPEAGCYAVYRDRKLVKLTTHPTYTIPKGSYEGACYSVRCANQRGGLGEPSAEVVYSRYK